MRAAGADDLAELAGIATAATLHAALVALLADAAPEHARADALAISDMAENLSLADVLEDLMNRAKEWPPTAARFFCEAFDALAERFCAAVARGAH